MATSMKKKETVNNSVDENIVQETEKENKAKAKRKFQADDMIPCMSITAGEYLYIGAKSDDLYSWADIGDVTEVAFEDLNYAARRGVNILFAPRVIVQDEDFIELFPKLNDIYAGLYSTQDLKEILSLSPTQIKKEVEKLPIGAKDSLSSIVMTEIDKGRYSDIKKIKVFDEIFGTNMLSRAMNAL